jgi:hypothetical protein
LQLVFELIKPPDAPIAFVEGKYLVCDLGLDGEVYDRLGVLVEEGLFLFNLDDVYFRIARVKKEQYLKG